MEQPNRARYTTVFQTETVASTNDELRKLARAGASAGTVVMAKTQTNGRGRRGHNFFSGEGGVYLSYLFRNPCPAVEALALTPVTAVALLLAVERFCGISVSVKWVNDLMIGGRKLGGILTEIATRPEDPRQLDYAVIGIGLNANTSQFPAELAEIATSLFRETGVNYSLSELAMGIIGSLDSVLGDWKSEKWWWMYRERCMTLGKPVMYPDRQTAGAVVAVDIDRDYGLIVENENGIRETLRAGEVCLLPECGQTQN